MISLSTLAANLETALSKNGNFKFKIFSDTGKFKKAVRNINTVTEYINGELRLMGSEVSNLTDGSVFATQTCKLNIIVGLEDEEETEVITDSTGKVVQTIMGSREKIEKVRAILDGLFSQNTTDSITDGKKTYLVSTVYQLAESGERSQVQILGNSYTFTAYIYYMFVENGINTRNTVFVLDGVTIPYQSVTVYRTPTMDGNVYADSKNGATKNISSQSNFSVSFELPALTDSTTADMLDYLLEGSLNRAHFLTFTVGNKTQSYIVTYGENKIIGETIKNVGQTLTLVECPDEYDLISFSDKYHVYKCEPRTTIPKSIRSSQNIGSNAIVFNFTTKQFSSLGREVKLNTLPVTLYTVVDLDVKAGDLIVCNFQKYNDIIYDGFEEV